MEQADGRRPASLSASCVSRGLSPTKVIQTDSRESRSCLFTSLPSGQAAQRNSRQICSDCTSQELGGTPAAQARSAAVLSDTPSVTGASAGSGDQATPLGLVPDWGTASRPLLTPRCRTDGHNDGSDSDDVGLWREHPCTTRQASTLAHHL